MRTRLAWSSLGESPAAPKLSMRPARSSRPAMPMRCTKSPSPWRMNTEAISCRRGSSRMMPKVSRSI
jgi:hypothetical protein